MLNAEKWYKMLLECDQLSKSFHFCHKSIFFLSFPLHCVSTQWKLLYQSEIILKNGICCCNKWKRMPSIRSAIYQTLRTPKICLNSRKNSINISDCPLLRTWWAWLGTRAHDTHIISCWSLKGILCRLWFMMGHAFSGQQYTTIIVRLLYIYIRIFRNGIFFSLLYWVDICFFSLVFFFSFSFSICWFWYWHERRSAAHQQHKTNKPRHDDHDLLLSLAIRTPYTDPSESKLAMKFHWTEYILIKLLSYDDARTRILWFPPKWCSHTHNPTTTTIFFSHASRIHSPLFRYVLYLFVFLFFSFSFFHLADVACVRGRALVCVCAFANRKTKKGRESKMKTSDWTVAAAACR